MITVPAFYRQFGRQVKLETGTQNPKPEILGTRNPKPEILNLDPESRNPKPGTAHFKLLSLNRPES